MIPKQKKINIPLIGLGTYKLIGEECINTVQKALELGYRHIDTADAYENHKPIGKAIKNFPRNELFLTTKIYLQDLSSAKVRSSVPRYLKELQTDYIDLLLIHWPSPEFKLNETLEAMMRCKEEGLIKSIGVSNFVRKNLEDLEPYHFPILTNQIELHPYFQRRELVKACTKAGISITAYRPLAKGAFEQDPILKKIGDKHHKSPSQIVLRWLIQQDIVAIPKAAKLQHLKDNMSIFDFSLSADEMKTIDALDQGKRYCAPEGYPVFPD